MRPWLAPLVVCLAFPAAAAAAPPWSAGALVAQEHVSDPTVLFTSSGGAVFWQHAPDISSAPTEVRAAPLDGGDPLAERVVSLFAGPVAAGRRFVFAGVARGRRSDLLAGVAGRPAAPFAPRRVGRIPGRFTNAVASGSAVAYRVGNPEEPGLEYVALARLKRRFGSATQISPRGEILAIALASNRHGDVLAVWLRDDKLEARIVTARGVRSPVRRVARTSAATGLDVALANDGRAAVGWLEQTVTEGEVSGPARFFAAIRPAGRRFGRPQLLEHYPDRAIAGRFGVRVGITRGRMIAAWTGRHEIRAAIANGSRFGPAHPLGLLGEDAIGRGGGIADVATGPAGEALVVWLQPGGDSVYVLAAPLLRGAAEFGSSEVVSEGEPAIVSASAAFDPITGDPAIAWWAVADAFDRILVAARPAF